MADYRLLPTWADTNNATLRAGSSVRCSIVLKGTTKKVALFLAACGEPHVAEPGPDRQRPPVRIGSHVGQFAQALHHRIVVHDDRRFVLADLRDGLANAPREG